VLIGPFDDELGLLGIGRCDDGGSDQVILVKHMETIVSLRINMMLTKTKYLGLSEIPPIDERLVVQFDVLSSNGFLELIDSRVELASRHTRWENR